jgi:YfiH family protein
MQSAAPLVWYESPLLAERGVPHAFSTRQGGISAKPFDSLNLGNPAQAPRDMPENIAANYALLQNAIGCACRRRLWSHQVHGAGVLMVEAHQAENFECGQPGDALVCTDPSCLLAIRTADCVPILLASDDGAAVAAVHAGWRGIIAGVIGAAIESLISRGHLGSANGLVAAIGPCIGIEAMEVGPEVVAKFDEAFVDNPPLRRQADGKGHLDLRDACWRQLVAAGLVDERIDMSDRCTHRDAGEFFSHRRCGGVTGRMAAVSGAATR